MAKPRVFSDLGFFSEECFPTISEQWISSLESPFSAQSNSTTGEWKVSNKPRMVFYLVTKYPRYATDLPVSKGEIQPTQSNLAEGRIQGYNSWMQWEINWIDACGFRSTVRLLGFERLVAWKLLPNISFPLWFLANPNKVSDLESLRREFSKLRRLLKFTNEFSWKQAKLQSIATLELRKGSLGWKLKFVVVRRLWSHHFTENKQSSYFADFHLRKAFIASFKVSGCF